MWRVEMNKSVQVIFYNAYLNQLFVMESTAEEMLLMTIGLDGHHTWKYIGTL
jgi:hypothetical protein